MSVWYDRIVLGGILFLIVFTPLAFGSVHLWAFSLMEGVIFLLVIVWMAKLLFSGQAPTLHSQTLEHRAQPSRLIPYLLHSSALPFGLFVGLILFQLLPLPPSLLHFISPATHELYAKSLPGWPERIPYAELSSQMLDPQETVTWVLLPTREEVAQGTAVPFAGSQSVLPDSQSSVSNSFSNLWRPLSLAPSLTRTDLLKLCAYVCFFLLVFLYPFSPSQRTSDQRFTASGLPRSEERFVRTILLTVLCTGLLIAVVGLLQQVTWNGKILWFFVPHDWEVVHQDIASRATGPFVSHVHFANYLVLILPVALVGGLFHTFLAAEGQPGALRLFCGFSVLILVSGILLSLSRGGWIGIALGVGLLLWVFLTLPEERRDAFFCRSRGSLVRFSVVCFLLLLVLALLLVGPQGRSGVDIRLEETVQQETSLWTRVAVWQDSLAMIRDFPLLGVGLGAWQEIFPRYQRPPWSPAFFREAHNDYLELLVETGVLGGILLAWFFWQVGRRLFRSLPLLPAQVLPVSTALFAALGIMAFHEFFDFNLQIPANAFLFTLFLGMSLRLTRAAERQWARAAEATTGSPPRRIAMPAAGIGVVAFLLLVVALRQSSPPPPYQAERITSLASAREVLLSHPARSSAHLSLFELLKDKVPPSQRLRELQIALWLDPRNPSVRDLYAVNLLQQGREDDGLQEISQSVFLSPSLSTHFFLSPRLMPWLSAREQQAIEQGFQRALTAGQGKVVNELGAMYAALRRFADEGRLYEEAARAEDTLDERVHYLLRAGLAYTQAGERARAEKLFRHVIAAAPQDLRAYQYLITQIFASSGDLDSAKAISAEGVRKGADPFSLALALAEAAQTVGDREETKTALLQALTLQPFSFEAHFRLGLLYFAEQDFDRAILCWRRVIDLNPHAASAFYHLGLAEERRYQFFAAENAYARAAALAPDNPDYQNRYQAFRQQIANEGTSAAVSLPDSLPRAQ